MNGVGMKGRVIGGIILLVGSVALGILAGDHFFDVYRETVPPAVLTSFNSATSHGWFLIRGAMLGGVIFLWTVAAVLINESLVRWANRSAKRGSAPASTSGSGPGAPLR